MKRVFATFISFLLFCQCYAQQEIKLIQVIDSCVLSKECTYYIFSAYLDNKINDTIFFEDNSEMQDLIDNMHNECTFLLSPSLRRTRKIICDVEFKDNNNSRVYNTNKNINFELFELIKCKPKRDESLQYFGDKIVMLPYSKIKVMVHFFLRKKSSNCESINLKIAAYTKSKGLHLISIDPNGLFP